MPFAPRWPFKPPWSTAPSDSMPTGSDPRHPERGPGTHRRWAGAPLWAPAILLGLTGVYLLAWATVGRGRWCRACKRFDRV